LEPSQSSEKNPWKLTNDIEIVVIFRDFYFFSFFEVFLVARFLELYGSYGNYLEFKRHQAGFKIVLDGISPLKM